MATDILSMFDASSQNYDADVAPKSISYLNKRDPFHADFRVNNAFMKSSQKDGGATKYMIFELEYLSGTYTHGGERAGELAEEGDLVSFMVNLTTVPVNQRKFVVKELLTVVDACLGGRPGSGVALENEASVQAKKKSALEDIVGEAAMEFVTQEGANYRVSGIARAVLGGLLNDSRISLNTGDEPNSKGWYAFSATTVAPANDLDACLSALPTS